LGVFTMGSRLELQTKLEQLIGNENVYFQPPASIKLSYPCIIYSIGSGDAKHADNKVYKYTHNYEVIFISKKPTLSIIEQMMTEFEMCKLSRAYSADNLNHYAFNLYY
jgi:hypothetical protein